MSVIRSIQLFSIAFGRAILLVRVRSVACQTYERGCDPLQRDATEDLQAIDPPDLFASGSLVIRGSLPPPTARCTSTLDTKPTEEQKRIYRMLGLSEQPLRTRRYVVQSTGRDETADAILPT